MVLQLRGREAGLVVVGRVLVEVGQQDGLRVGGLDVFARAAVAVAAGADFVVEAAVDFVLFRAEDGGEVVCHGGWCVADLCGRWCGLWIWKTVVFVECGTVAFVVSED